MLKADSIAELEVILKDLTYEEAMFSVGYLLALWDDELEAENVGDDD